uniref:FKBP_N_2 domain-containing protein n=1 Tax=Glossina brevipalpis TaxID=37001 RepID=A0A1A9W9E5_9MUSC
MEWYIGTEWEMPHKGLYKKVLAMDYKKLNKPTILSKVIVNIQEVKNLNGRETLYLIDQNANQDLTMEMSAALTPIDYYLEILVQQMIEGETAQCSLQTKTDKIMCILTLKNILESEEIQNLTAPEMYQLALRYKENGVKMFKTYPKFAHEYFTRAAKCLISYKKFENLTKIQDGIEGKDMLDLMLQIHTNLAACLLNEKRYEDVIYHTKFVENSSHPAEKSIYRRAVAYYHMKEYELAQKTIEKLPNYREKKEFVNLSQKIKDGWKTSNNQYKGMGTWQHNKFETQLIEILKKKVFT